MQTLSKIIFGSLLVVILGSNLLLAPVASAAGSTKAAIDANLQAAAEQGAGFGKPQTHPQLIIVSIIKGLLTLVGTVLFALMVYAGFLWMTAGGNEEQVTKATALIKNGIIGLIITLASYSITIAATNLAVGEPIGHGLWSNTGSSVDQVTQDAWSSLFGN